MSLPPTFIELSRFWPDIGTVHFRAPVSTETESLFFVTFTSPLVPPEPTDKVTAKSIPAGTTVAIPLNLMEPSGQYASGHD